MKHLKLYEDISFHDLTLEIKDLFQDLEDDFNVGIEIKKLNIEPPFDYYCVYIIFYDETIPEKFLPTLSQYIDRFEDTLPLQIRELMLIGSLPPMYGDIGKSGRVWSTPNIKSKTWIKELEKLNSDCRQLGKGELTTLVIQIRSL